MSESRLLGSRIKGAGRVSLQSWSHNALGPPWRWWREWAWFGKSLAWRIFGGTAATNTLKEALLLRVPTFPPASRPRCSTVISASLWGEAPHCPLDFGGLQLGSSSLPPQAYLEGLGPCLCGELKRRGGGGLPQSHVAGASGIFMARQCGSAASIAAAHTHAPGFWG